MRTLVIHPEDSTTLFLDVIYKNCNDIELINERNPSNKTIKNALNSHSRIILLGHGTEYGLLSGQNIKTHSFDRTIVGCEHVQFLRNKELICIWCNANIFGEKYKLNGLFSGMVISELIEAFEWGVNTTQEELDRENISYANNLRFCLDNYNLESAPIELLKLDSSRTDLTNFNYSSLYYL